MEKLKQSAANPPATDAAVEFADEIQLVPGATIGKVVLGTSLRNAGGGVLESGRAEIWVRVIDQQGSNVHSERAEPQNERLDPQGTSWTAATAPVAEGDHGVSFRLHLDGKQVAEKPSGRYAVTITLQQTHKVLDKKVGYLSIDERCYVPPNFEFFSRAF